MKRRWVFRPPRVKKLSSIPGVRLKKWGVFPLYTQPFLSSSHRKLENSSWSR